MSSQKIAVTRLDLEGRRIVWTFADGSTRTIEYDDLPANIKVQAALDRIRDKATDCYAATAKEGGDDPVQWAIDQHDATASAILNGEWNRSGAVKGMVYEAIAATTGQPIDTIIAVFTAMDKDVREDKLKGIRNHPKFKEEYTKLQAAKEAKKAAKAKPLDLSEFGIEAEE